MHVQWTEPGHFLLLRSPDPKENSMRMIRDGPGFACLVYARVHMKRAKKCWCKTALTPALSWLKVVKSIHLNNIKWSWMTFAYSRLHGLAVVVSWVDVHWCNREPLPYSVPCGLNHRLLQSMRNLHMKVIVPLSLLPLCGNRWSENNESLVKQDG